MKTTIVNAKPLHHCSLSKQIVELGGRGFNCSTKVKPIKNSFSAMYTFSTEKGAVSLVTANEFDCGTVNEGLRHRVFFNGDSQLYSLHTPTSDTAKPFEVTILGSSWEVMLSKLKALWPNRVVFNLDKPEHF